MIVSNPNNLAKHELINLLKNVKSGTRVLNPRQQKQAIMMYLFGYPIATIASHFNVPKHYLYPFFKVYKLAEGTLMIEAIEALCAATQFTDIENAINITEASYLFEAARNSNGN